MKIFEKIKKDYLILGTDEPFHIAYLVSGILKNFGKLEDSELQNKTIELIKFLVESNLFQIVNTKDGINFEKSNISLEENISIVKNIFKEELLYALVFWIDLTPKGWEEAKNYLLKEIHIKEKILISKRINFNSIMDLIKQEFNTDDFDEIKYEATNILSVLIHNQFIKGWLENKIFSFYNLSDQDKIEYEIEKIKNNPKIGEVFYFNNTPATDALVEKWQTCGGRLVPKWYDLIDNR